MQNIKKAHNHCFLIKSAIKEVVKERELKMGLMNFMDRKVEIENFNVIDLEQINLNLEVKRYGIENIMSAENQIQGTKCGYVKNFNYFSKNGWFNSLRKNAKNV